MAASFLTGFRFAAAGAVREGMVGTVAVRARHSMVSLQDERLTPKEKAVVDRLCHIGSHNKIVILAKPAEVNVTDRDPMQTIADLSEAKYLDTCLSTLTQGHSAEIASFTTTRPPYTHMQFAERIVEPLVGLAKDKPWIKHQTIGMIISPSESCFKRAVPVISRLAEEGFNLRVNFIATSDTGYASANLKFSSVADANKKYLELIREHFIATGLNDVVQSGVFVSGMPNGVDTETDTTEASFQTMDCFREVLGGNTLFIASSTRGCFEPMVFGRFLIRAKAEHYRVGVHAHYNAHLTVWQNVRTISHQFAMARLAGVSWFDSSSTGQGHSMAGKKEGEAATYSKQLIGNVHTSLYQVLVAKTSIPQVYPPYFERTLFAARHFGSHIGGGDRYLTFLQDLPETAIEQGLRDGRRDMELLLDESQA